MQPRRQRRSNFALILLATQLARVGFDRIPPVTLLTIIGQVVVHLRLLDIDWPSIYDVCVSAAHVWHYRDWKRCLLAAFFHLDDWHLYYNMVSFVWKGITLERHYGSGYFAFIIAVFAVLTNFVLVGLNILLGEYVIMDASYTIQCAAGFSGVLFALKVLTTYLLPPGVHYVLGWIPVPSRYAVWAELVFIQIMVPNASFTGHLAGILVGLLYVKGPLGTIMEGFFSMFTGFSVRGAADDDDTDGWDGDQRTYYRQSGTSGHRPHSGAGGNYNSNRAEPSAPPPAYGEVNPEPGARLYPDLNRRNPPYPTDDVPGMPYPQAPDMERMRSARLNRFQRYE